MLTQRYDQTLVDEQRAATAYRVTEARLKYAQQAQDAGQQQLARLAASEFESGGGFSPMTAMLGNSSGPQGYLNRVGLGTVLAQACTDTVAQAQANDVVANAFRTQAHDLLGRSSRTCAAANPLKLAIQAAVARQQALVRASRTSGTSWPARWPAPRLTWPRWSRPGGGPGRRRGGGGAKAAAPASAGAAARRAARRAPPGPVLGVGLGRVGQPGRRRRQLGAHQLGKPYQWGAAGPEPTTARA